MEIYIQYPDRSSLSVLVFELTGASKEEHIRNKCDCDAICGGSVVRLIDGDKRWGLDIYKSIDLKLSWIWMEFDVARSPLLIDWHGVS